MIGKRLALAAVAALAACSHALRSETWRKAGATAHAPSDGAAIRVVDMARPVRFRDDSVAVMIGQPFEVLGWLEAYGPGSGARGREVALQSLRRRAAALGATTIILTSVHLSPPYTVVGADALRLLPPLPDAAARCDSLVPSMERVVACREAYRQSPEARFQRALAWSFASLARTSGLTGLQQQDARGDAALAILQAADRDSAFAHPAAHIAEALRVYGDSVAAYRAIGYLLGSRNHFGDAQSGGVEAFREALRVAPDSDAVRHELGEELLALRRYDEAADAYRSILRRTPTDARAWSRLGVSLGRQERHVDAMRAWARTLELRPGYFRGILDIDRDREYGEYKRSRHFAGAQPPASPDSIP